MLVQLIKEIANLKWYVIIYAIAAIVFCALIYLGTREFDWSFKKIRFFAVLYNLNKRGLIAVSLILGRFVYVICMAVLGGSEGFWDLLVLLLFTIVIAIISRSAKTLIQILSYAAVFAITLTENMLTQFYRDVDSNVMIAVVAVFFGIFAVLYACYQTLTAYNNVMVKSAMIDKQLFDKEFYEKSAAGTSQI